MEKQRYLIELAYNGKDYYGWQVQPNDISVQEVIEKQLSKLQSNQPVQIVGCGRTDTGVHAHYYVIHVDLPTIEDQRQFLYKMNSMLPPSIALFAVRPVKADFHARFDATSRTYRYFVHQQKDPFLHDRSLLVLNALDFDQMNRAAVHLLGKKDFASFSKLHTDVKTTICTVSKAEWVKVSETEYYFEITADRFLRNMVRAIVGTLLDVGLGKAASDSIDAILLAKNRQEASTSAPAHGLFLWDITYPNT